MTNDTTDSANALEEINNLHTKTYIPAIVLITVIIVVGFVSNLFAFLFYTFRATKSAFQVIIAILSLNDVLTNLFLLHDVVELCYFVDYRSAAVCKLSYFLKHWLVGNSLLIIVTVALDRHRLVCHPFATQVTVKIAKFIVLGVVVFSFCISLHYFATSAVEVVTFQADNGTAVAGYHCALSNSPSLSTVIDVFHYTDICIHALCIGSLIVFYSLVIRKLSHSRHRLDSHNSVIFRKGKAALDDHDHTEHSVSAGQIHLDNDTFTSCAHSTDATQTTQVPHTNKDLIANCDAKDTGTSSKKKRKNRKHVVSHMHGPEVKITIMAFVITVASVVCFVPYYASMMLGEANMDGTGVLYSVGEIIARRFYMLNSAVNPFIMLYFNAIFRQYVTNILCKVRCKVCNFKHVFHVK